jgi:predicted transcriptional regulator
MATTVRVDTTLHETLKRIADTEHRSIGSVIEDAIERYQVEKFWLQMEADYARIQEDPDAWNDYLKEADEWQALSGDTLADEPPYDTPEPEEGIRANAKSEGR